jgi:hypothetical protein
LFPAWSEVKIDNDNKCDPNAFKQKISQLFASGSMFVSIKHLDQAADMCLGAPGLSRRPPTPKAYTAHILRPMRRKIESMQTYPKA